MHIGITGASGFIGRRVVQDALSRGHRVTPFSRKPATQFPGCEPVRFFGLNMDVTELDAVIHLAGEPIIGLWTKNKRNRILRSRVGGIQWIVAAVERSTHKPAVLVTASGVDIYGDRAEESLTEASSTASVSFLAQVAGAIEKEGSAVETAGLRHVPVRIAMVLGPNDGALKVMKAAFRFGLGGRIGSGNQWMPWVHIADISALFLHAAETQSIRGPMNGVSPNPVRNREFTKLMGEQLRRPTIFTVPEFALRMLPGHQGSLVLNSQRIVPAVALRTGFHFQFPDLRVALADALR
jgi:uncharacterized protein